VEGKLAKAAREAGLEGEVAEAVLSQGTRADGSTNANARFYLAVLGVLPWIGVMISAILARWAENEQHGLNEFHRRWLEEHDGRLAELRRTIGQIEARVSEFGQEAQRRLNSDDYVALARKGFRVWDRSDTHEKRDLIRKLLTNAACSRIASDEFVGRFIEWIDQYNELHFQVVRCVFKEPQITRFGIWQSIRGEAVREDSAEADLFKLLIRDLSTGGVIRQYRQSDGAGHFYKRQRTVRRTASAAVMRSAFDDEELYVLTDLGSHFVSYALNEVVPRLDEHESRP
jgi:hypothetical protein